MAHPVMTFLGAVGIGFRDYGGCDLSDNIFPDQEKENKADHNAIISEDFKSVLL
jgi:hypothetical protein